ncbi:MAG: hypothetical protein RSE23_14270 [Clostridia bacterium]
MKKFITAILLLCLLLPSIASAKKQKKEQPIPERFAAVMEVCNATTIKEMHKNLTDYIVATFDQSYSIRNMPLVVRFGGTTKELIADKRHWAMAVVSTKDVDIQEMLDQNMIYYGGFSMMAPSVLCLWLVPSSLKTFKPKDLRYSYDIFFFDYDEQTDDATVLLFNKKYPVVDGIYAQALLDMRSPEQKRAMEGIARVNSWTAEKLIANPDDWDTAQITVPYPNGLEQLDQAGMLLDLSQSDYLASRKSVEKGVEGWDGLPNGIFSLDNRLIGVPCYPFVVYESHDQVQVLIINAKGSHIEDAIRYVEYHIKGMEDVALTPDDEAFERNCLEYSTALWEPQQ